MAHNMLQEHATEAVTFDIGSHDEADLVADDSADADDLSTAFERGEGGTAESEQPRHKSRTPTRRTCKAHPQIVLRQRPAKARVGGLVLDASQTAYKNLSEFGNEDALYLAHNRWPPCGGATFRINGAISGDLAHEILRCNQMTKDICWNRRLHGPA